MEVIWIVLVIFLVVSWVLVFLNGGILRLIFGGKILVILNLWLVMILFLGLRYWRNLDFCVMYLLEILLFYNFDIKIIWLFGEILINILNVLWCL